MAGIMTDEEKALIRMHINALEMLERAMTAMPSELTKEAEKFKERMLGRGEVKRCRVCGQLQ